MAEIPDFCPGKFVTLSEIRTMLKKSRNDQRIFIGLGGIILICSIISSFNVTDPIELSASVSGTLVPSHSFGGEVRSTASPHASNPLIISPDVAKALGQADSVIQKTRKFLGSENDDEDDENVHFGHPTSKGSKLEIHSTGHTGAVSKSNIKASNVHETPQQLSKEEDNSELWNTEQAMKKELDAQTAHKSGKLWQHTVNIVHRTDPSAKLISKLSPERVGAGQVKKAVSLKRVETKPITMDSRLKAELDAKTKDDMGQMEAKTVAFQKQGLNRIAHESKVAETATAHKTMPLSDMKKMLTSQLDSSVNSVVKRAKQLQSFNSDSQLEKRLKAELDEKTEKQEKKLLQSQSVKRSLVLARRKLHGRVTRAAKVRMQLSKEMREENAIRKQLDMRAEKAGKRMLKSEINDKSAPAKGQGHGTSREALEAALRKRLESRAQQMLKKSPQQQGTAAKGAHHLQDYLRKQLDANDATQRKQLYRKTVQNKLLKGIHNSHSAVRARQLHAAAMRLFKSSMQRSKRKGGGEPEPLDIAQERRALDRSMRPADKATAELMKETLQRASHHEPFAGLHQQEEEERRRAAAAPPPPNVHTATVKLMKEALERSGGREPFAGLHRREAIESQAAAKRQSQSVDVHTALVRVMESSLRRAKGVRPFADLHGGASAAVGGGVHDMAAANRESTMRAGGLARKGKLDALVLGHYKELEDADETAKRIRRARSKTVHEAEQDEEQAVE